MRRHESGPALNLLDLLYVPLVILTSPVWARKARGDWRARFGHGEPLGAKSRPRVLVHAVSVGEVQALRALVPMLAERAEVVVSVGTDTGIARARELFAQQAEVVRYPLDFSRSVRRFLDRVQPDAVALTELELWPNFMRACARRGIPVGVINGRLSERSFRGYRRWRWYLGRMFTQLAFAAVQDEPYAERFAHMGTPGDRIRVTGSMKFDAPGLDRAGEHRARGEELTRALGIDPTRPLVVAGSTAEDEESLLHEALARVAPDAQLLCAPRHPQRFEDAARALPGCVRRSEAKQGTREVGRASRFLLDTIGELGDAYAVADVVVLGRSFGTLHGSDPLEPAAMGRPIVMGPRAGDFKTPVELLERAGGIVRTDRLALGRVLGELLADTARRQRLGDAARACVAQNRGASERHAAMILDLLTAAGA